MKRLAIIALAAGLSAAPHALALDDEHARRAEAMITRSIEWLRAQQDDATGGWNVPPAPASPDEPRSPVFPAITALVVQGMLLQPGVDADDPDVAHALAFLKSFVQPDGGIYDRILPSYNTAIALSALAMADDAESNAAIKPAQDFLRALQWSEASNNALGGAEAPQPVTKDHPFYGGVGYGRHGRPDLSNLNWMLQGLKDSGLPADDAAYQRALVFLSRVQMLDEVNDMPYADGAAQGGFIYATSVNKDQVGSGQTQIDGEDARLEERSEDGPVSSLRCYGSMTYAGFKSMLFADLSRDDPRVAAAFDWLRRHYTMAENPNVGTDGYYYYLVTLSRALDAWGEPAIEVLGVRPNERAPKGAPNPGEVRDWANDLVAALEPLQNADGSFRSIDDRWMENNQVLITAYALLALQHAVR
ncbi:MAG: hypothetical protein IBJ10_10340 [Phycisphaerales bacterium]|nr:hypothetical protein [Phycisphaerales bacterium]